LTPYKLDKINIGINYIKPEKIVEFTKDEEIIQDLFLNNRSPDSLETLITFVYLGLFFALVLILILKD
jgi:hypothetical protein